jgi:hypothetical protein
MDLAILTHRIATDKDFATQFKIDPQDTLRRSGLTFDPASLHTLMSILQKPISLIDLLKDTVIGPDDPTNWSFRSTTVTTSNERIS